MTAELALAPWHHAPLIGFDVESTGVDVETDRIVTATVARVDLAGEAEVNNWLINPGVEIPEGAAAIHGITTEKARADGADPERTLEAIGRTLIEYLTPAPGTMPSPLVIYNAPYDHTIFDRECRRYGLPTLFELAELAGIEVYTIDPLVIDKAANKYVKGKGQRQLTPTCARYGITLANAHESEADVIASVALARAIALKHPVVGEATLSQLQGWQRKWHSGQATDFANWLARTAMTKGGEERAELETKAASVRSEVGRWPIRPMPVAAE